MEKKYIFICGLHRSGTSTLTRILGNSNLVSIHTNTNVIENEGQHIQSIYNSADKHGGVGHFGFDKNYHYTEESPLLNNNNNKKILEEWSEYWDLNRKILVEKSPPNIIHTRYLQELLPEPYFIIIIRHPFPVAIATSNMKKKYQNTCDSIEFYIEHWLHCHKILYSDLKKIKNYIIFKYEELNIDTFQSKIDKFLGEKLSIDRNLIVQIFNSMQESNKNYLKNIPEYIIDKYEKKINQYNYSFKYPFYTFYTF